MRWCSRKAWDAQEGAKARTPRIGAVPELEGCTESSTLQEAEMKLRDRMLFGGYVKGYGLKDLESIGIYSVFALVSL